MQNVSNLSLHLFNIPITFKIDFINCKVFRMFGIILWLRKFSMFEEDSAFVQNALMKDRIVRFDKILKIFNFISN